MLCKSDKPSIIIITHSEEHASSRRRTRKTQNLGPQQRTQEAVIQLMFHYHPVMATPGFWTAQCFFINRFFR